MILMIRPVMEHLLLPMCSWTLKQVFIRCIKKYSGTWAKWCSLVPMANLMFQNVTSIQTLYFYMGQSWQFSEFIRNKRICGFWKKRNAKLDTWIVFKSQVSFLLLCLHCEDFNLNIILSYFIIVLVVEMQNLTG